MTWLRNKISFQWRRRLYTILEKIKVPHVLTHYGPHMKNSIGKSVTVLKLLNRAIDCRQAEPCSSIRLDFIPKRVKMSIPRNGQKNLRITSTEKKNVVTPLKVDRFRRNFYWRYFTSWTTSM